MSTDVEHVSPPKIISEDNGLVYVPRADEPDLLPQVHQSGLGGDDEFCDALSDVLAYPVWEGQMWFLPLALQLAAIYRAGDRRLWRVRLNESPDSFCELVWQIAYRRASERIGDIFVEAERPARSTSQASSTYSMLLATLVRELTRENDGARTSPADASVVTDRQEDDGASYGLRALLASRIRDVRIFDRRADSSSQRGPQSSAFLMSSSPTGSRRLPTSRSVENCVPGMIDDELDEIADSPSLIDNSPSSRNALHSAVAGSEVAPDSSATDAGPSSQAENPAAPHDETSSIIRASEAVVDEPLGLAPRHEEYSPVRSNRYGAQRPSDAGPRAHSHAEEGSDHVNHQSYQGDDDDDNNDFAGNGDLAVARLFQGAGRGSILAKSPSGLKTSIACSYLPVGSNTCRHASEDERAPRLLS
ncbi:hypothetical protein F4778DRAFT_795324 [Xylariomycetidae sp. FL2044]|nr:hypothetical protein F4778DRAFT_795324 [Xylariomycetidae sp. FL2044]